MADLVREERERFYQLHLAICKASAAFARGKEACANVPKEIVARLGALAYRRMDHPDYKSRALAFAAIQAEDVEKILSGMDRFMEEFYASRIFTFLKRAMSRRRSKLSRIQPLVEAFVKTFRTGRRPRDVESSPARQLAALALFESYFGGFWGKGVRHGRAHTLYRPQILAWGGFDSLADARREYEAIADPKGLRQVLFQQLVRMKKAEDNQGAPG